MPPRKNKNDERNNYMSNPTFIINDLMNQSSRTGEYMHDSLSDEILKDICKRITGSDIYDIQYVKK